MVLSVKVRHDTADGVWYVESSDLPGLNAESKTFDELVEIIIDAVPDLIESNLPGTDLGNEPSIPLRVEVLVDAPRASAA